MANADWDIMDMDRDQEGDSFREEFDICCPGGTVYFYDNGRCTETVGGKKYMLYGGYHYDLEANGDWNDNAPQHITYIGMNAPRSIFPASPSPGPDDSISNQASRPNSQADSIDSSAQQQMHADQVPPNMAGNYTEAPSDASNAVDTLHSAPSSDYNTSQHHDDLSSCGNSQASKISDRLQRLQGVGDGHDTSGDTRPAELDGNYLYYGTDKPYPQNSIADMSDGPRAVPNNDAGLLLNSTRTFSEQQLTDSDYLPGRAFNTPGTSFFSGMAQVPEGSVPVDKSDQGAQQDYSGKWTDTQGDGASNAYGNNFRQNDSSFNAYQDVNTVFTDGAGSQWVPQDGTGVYSANDQQGGYPSDPTFYNDKSCLQEPSNEPVYDHTQQGYYEYSQGADSQYDPPSQTGDYSHYDQHGGGPSGSGSRSRHDHDHKKSSKSKSGHSHRRR